MLCGGGWGRKEGGITQIFCLLAFLFLPSQNKNQNGGYFHAASIMDDSGDTII